MDVRITLPAVLTALFLTWKLFQLARNKRLARQTGLPYALSPIHELETLAFFTDVLLRCYCQKHLMRGQGWPNWARFMVKNWHYEDKGRAHREYGAVFLVVSTGGIICYSADADVSLGMVVKRRAFVKMRALMKMLEVFGPNVVSTNGELWRDHIRITLPSFGEQVQNLVWDETTRQTDMLCQSWARSGKIGIKESIYQLTMNTMSLASFGWSVDWTSGQDCIPAGHRMSLVEALTKVISHLPSILLLPRFLLPILPGRTAHIACSEFETYMDELIASESRLLAEGGSGELRRETLLTALLRARRESVAESQSQGSASFSLTDQEIKGNIFIFLLAGYDTTANTMIYTCMVLAIYQDIQDKARQEVDSIYARISGSDHQELSYSKHFHDLRYLLAVMYEVMRVFPTVLPITRETESAQQVAMPAGGHSGENGTKAFLPAGTITVVNITGTHYSETNWPSPHIIEPRRWLSQDPNKFDPLNPPPSHGEEAVSIPGHKKGTFMTFNEGPRACLGRNFARAEFLAFFSRLLRKYRLELDKGVSGAALEWTLRCSSGGSPVTLTPPHDIKLRLVPREK
ncbi:hypothetical protein DHEL01_v209186 [Diaporthe helianthi]|uniref:Cytochrome P450 n=1 Tax=Diaporthe helianthi TaxID=158607 RepID=A0A2P5HQA0_DIAHE|nr:hypothetical protein DHEL01_v209186 [Diaporthe helianthi]